MNKIENNNLITQKIEFLERFIVDNDDLIALETLIGKFNIFDALNITWAEIRHSNFLAFILDPNESHELGDLFLKPLLMDILKSTPEQLRQKLSPIDLDSSELSGVEIKREWHHIDLLIICENPKFIVVIENKIRSQEHSDQLNRYESTVTEIFGNVPIFFVYLTPNSYEPSSDSWIPYSYNDIYRILLRTRETYRNAIGEDVLVFLDHYLTLIGTRFMNDPKIDDLCQKIYKKHRLALDLIYERAGSSTSIALDIVETLLNESDLWHIFLRTGNYIDFIPKSWLSWLPRYGLDRKDAPQSWFIFRFDLLKDDANKELVFYAEVRRMSDIQKREKVITALISEGSKFDLKRTKKAVSPHYSRFGRASVLKFPLDNEPQPDTFKKAITKKLNDLDSHLKGLESLLKSHS